ncbi:MAG: CoA pyrophosphatase [Chloroflexota bacterium]
MTSPPDQANRFAQQTIQQKLDGKPPYKFWWRRLAKRAATGALLSDDPTVTGDDGTHVLLMKRTERPGDPWSGDMSFPGGRMDPGDKIIYTTVLREFEEEVGFDLATGSAYLGRLADTMARPPRWNRRPFVVTPFVFWQTAITQFKPDPTEVADLVWFPMNFLADRNNRQTMTWKRYNLEVELPCYWYKGNRLWGLTLRMLDDLLYKLN